MTPTHARTAANAVLLSAGLAAAYVVLTTPPLRRLAFQATRWWLGATVPAYLAGEIERSWQASAVGRAPLA